jgi:hypothetical protein
VNTDIEIKNLKAEIKRGHDAIDEMRRSGKEPDDVERAGLNLLDLSEKLEMSELRQELDKSALALRMMKFKGAGIEEQEMSNCTQTLRSEFSRKKGETLESWN